MSDPFIFSNQATQVFFSDDRNKPGWKVVLRKEACARREVLHLADTFITTTVEATGLTAPDEVLALLHAPSLVGAIKLSVEDNLLAHARY
jgi:hypothetical protein